MLTAVDFELIEKYYEWGIFYYVYSFFFIIIIHISISNNLKYSYKLCISVITFICVSRFENLKFFQEYFLKLYNHLQNKCSFFLSIAQHKPTILYSILESN